MCSYEHLCPHLLCKHLCCSLTSPPSYSVSFIGVAVLCLPFHSGCSLVLCLHLPDQNSSSEIQFYGLGLAPAPWDMLYSHLNLLRLPVALEFSLQLVLWAFYLQTWLLWTAIASALTLPLQFLLLLLAMELVEHKQDWVCSDPSFNRLLCWAASTANVVSKTSSFNGCAQLKCIKKLSKNPFQIFMPSHIFQHTVKKQCLNRKTLPQHILCDSGPRLQKKICLPCVTDQHLLILETFFTSLRPEPAAAV